MKRTIFSLFVALMAVSMLAKGKKDIVIKKSEGSITFVVDENLPAPKGHLELKDGAQIAKWKVGDGKNKNTIVATSFGDAKLWNSNHNAMFDMLMKAYAEHRPVVLSPDDVWLCISQGFAQHVNKNAEALRDKLVFHEDKMTLKVDSLLQIGGGDNGNDNDNDNGNDNENDKLDDAGMGLVDWQEVFDGLVNIMKENTKGEIVDNMCAAFSTTTVESRIASQITLMNAMQPFFKYVGEFSAACGIPYITLKGTEEDWQCVLDKARRLEQYDLKWWTDKLCPVLEEFVKTAQGKPDHQFWRCMMTQIPIDKLRGGGCSRIKPTEFDGWFLCLFPYDSNGRTPAKVTMRHDMPNSFKSTDFLYRLKDDYGNLLTEIPLTFAAGFAGVEESEESYELSLRIGWLVRRVPKEGEGKK